MNDTPKRAVTVDEEEEADPAGALNANRAPAWMGLVSLEKGYEREVFNGVIAIVVGEEEDVDWYVPNWVRRVTLD